MAETRYASLLFKTQEYHQIGPFRFPVYHDLLPGEVRALEKINREHAKATYQSLKLAKAIAKKRGIRPSEAVQLLNELGDSDQDLIFEFADELEDNQRNGFSVIEQQAASVTAFMQLRGEASFPNKPSDWVKTSDWEQSDTDMMPTQMMQDIFNLILWEREGWPEEGKDKSADSKKT
jgi:hypothetical protein